MLYFRFGTKTEVNNVLSILIELKEDQKIEQKHFQLLSHDPMCEDCYRMTISLPSCSVDSAVEWTPTASDISISMDTCQLVTLHWLSSNVSEELTKKHLLHIKVGSMGKRMKKIF